jgi:hypothetical protein
LPRPTGLFPLDRPAARGTQLLEIPPPPTGPEPTGGEDRCGKTGSRRKPPFPRFPCDGNQETASPDRLRFVTVGVPFAWKTKTRRTPRTPTAFSPMSSMFRSFFCGLLLAVTGALGAAPAAWEPPPGWTQTRGGARGTVVRVTTLAPHGPGSLGEALAFAGPRTIEFAVGGIIDLGGRSLKIAHPFVTVAGETAPAPGITLTNGGVGVVTHDVIVRHLRIRPGAGHRARRSGWEVDGLATGGGAHDVIVDQCSIAWSTDENLSASGPRFEGATPDAWRRNTSHRITFSRCLIAEGLNESTHAKGSHSKGSLIHDNAGDVLIYGNLYISNDDRNPFFKGGARGAVVNYLIHNPGKRVMQFALNLSEWSRYPMQRAAMTIVGNVARRGPSTAREIAFLESMGPVDVYLHDNLFLDRTGAPLARHGDAPRPREGTCAARNGRRLAPVQRAAFVAAGACRKTRGPNRRVGAGNRRCPPVGPRCRRPASDRGSAHGRRQDHRLRVRSRRPAATVAGAVERCSCRPHSSPYGVRVSPTESMQAADRDSRLPCWTAVRRGLLLHVSWRSGSVVKVRRSDMGRRTRIGVNRVLAGGFTRGEVGDGTSASHPVPRGHLSPH